MWRAQTSRKGWHFLNSVRQLAAEAAPLRMPEPPPKSNILRLFKILGISLPVATTGLLSYAWYDQEFRQHLLNIPYAKDLLGNVFPESDDIPPPAGIQKPKVFTSLEKAPVIIVPDAPMDVSFQKTSSGKEMELQINVVYQEECQTSEDLVVEDLLRKEADLNTFGKGGIGETADQKKSDKIAPSVDTRLQGRVVDDNAALEAAIYKLLASGPTLVAEAVKAQAEVATRIRNHAKLLKQAMDETIDTRKDAQWENVATANREREQALLEASERVSEAKKCVEKLQDVIQEGKTNQVTQNNSVILEASKQLNEFLKDLGSTNLQVRQAETEANAIQKYTDLVDKSRKLFQRELESLVGTAKPGSDIKLSEDDLNTLIAHAYRRMEQLQAQIAELQSQERQKLTTALEVQKINDVNITETSIAEGRQRFREELEAEKSKLEVEYLMKLETEVRKHLARQAAAHNDHLKEALTDQQKGLDVEFGRALQFRVLEEREKFQMEVTGWISRLKGIEAAIEARAASEKLTNSAQNLWLACIALTSLVNFGGDSGNLQPLRRNVETILQAGSTMPFVEQMASNFSSTALDRGVSTEEQLKQRFYRVSRICRRLGLIDTANASLYNYLLSYLHSLVLFDNVVATSETEEVDLNALDTFDLLAHAKYWMDKGNLELAMRFMIQLNGESYRAASDWIREAMLFLETKQITRTLTAYASASGLAKTF